VCARVWGEGGGVGVVAGGGLRGLEVRGWGLLVVFGGEVLWWCLAGGFVCVFGVSCLSVGGWCGLGGCWISHQKKTGTARPKGVTSRE